VQIFASVQHEVADITADDPNDGELSPKLSPTMINY